MIAVQALAIVFAAAMTYFTYLHYRRHEFSLTEFLFWQVLWTGLALIVIFPASVNFILENLHFARAFDFLTVGGIVILFGVTFRNYVLLRRTERKVEELTRALALKE